MPEQQPNPVNEVTDINSNPSETIILDENPSPEPESSEPEDEFPEYFITHDDSSLMKK